VGLFELWSVTMITRNCMHRSSPNWDCRIVTISSWLNFGSLAPPGPGKGSAAGEIFWLHLTIASAQCLLLPERFSFNLRKQKFCHLHNLLEPSRQNYAFAIGWVQFCLYTVDYSWSANWCIWGNEECSLLVNSPFLYVEVLLIMAWNMYM